MCLNVSMVRLFKNTGGERIKRMKSFVYVCKRELLWEHSAVGKRLLSHQTLSNTKQDRKNVRQIGRAHV